MRETNWLQKMALQMESSGVLSLKTQFNKHNYMSITRHKLKTDQARLQQ